MDSAAIGLVPRLAPEDQARADFYALLGRLFADAPDAALLAAIAAAPPLAAVTDDPDAPPPCLPAAWDALRAASAAMTAEAAADEYNDLFVGVGKCEVNLHGSHWIAGFMLEKPLVELRATLAELGLAARAASPVLEDHLAALCETMRTLIAGQGGRPPSALAVQRAFFDRHIAPWVFACCDAISESPVANYYRRVAELMHCFVAVERDSFAID